MSLEHEMMALEVRAFQAIVIKNAIKIYRHTGIKANTMYTPKNMLATAARITGKGPWKRTELALAQKALEEYIAMVKEVIS